jgi:hypothetical protein
MRSQYSYYQCCVLCDRSSAVPFIDRHHLLFAVVVKMSSSSSVSGQSVAPSSSSASVSYGRVLTAVSVLLLIHATMQTIQCQTQRSDASNAAQLRRC